MQQQQLDDGAQWEIVEEGDGGSGGGIVLTRTRIFDALLSDHKIAG